MKKIFMILTLLLAGIAVKGQQYVGRKVTAIDSVVTNHINARAGDVVTVLKALAVNDELTVRESGESTFITIDSDDDQNARLRFSDDGTAVWNMGFNNGNASFSLFNQGLAENAFSIDSTTNDVEFSGDVDITGALSKGSGTFKITHPLDTSKWLYHSFVEAPKADNIYRGQAELYQGYTMVGIDTASNMTVGTFEKLNHNVQVFVSNNDTWDLVKGSYSNGVLYIESQNALSRAIVDWLVIGERKDQTVIDWALTDEKGRLIPEWNKN